MGDHSKIVAEIERQTQFFADRIMNAIEAAGKECGGQPTMNAIASALVCVQANFLCAVPKGRARRELQERMAKTLPRAIETYEGKVAQSQVINLDRLQ